MKLKSITVSERKMTNDYILHDSIYDIIKKIKLQGQKISQWLSGAEDWLGTERLILHGMGALFVVIGVFFILM